jgi:hypothetical protein
VEQGFSAAVEQGFSAAVEQGFSTEWSRASALLASVRSLAPPRHARTPWCRSTSPSRRSRGSTPSPPFED